MPDLKDVLQMGFKRQMDASQLADLRIGTVTSASPLEITIDTTMAPLTSSVLYLTASVVEKKIPVLTHHHEITTLAHNHSVNGSNTTTGLSGTYDTEMSLSDVAAIENGNPLPVEDGYIILNRGLSKGDKVLLLRVASGQKFIVLSRVMEG